MTQEQAKFLADHYLADFAYETAVTQKVIGAVPEDKKDYRPDPVSKTAVALAWHIVLSEEWFLRSLVRGAFAMEEEKIPEDNSIAAALAHYRSSVPALVEEVKALPGEKLAERLDFFGMFQNPAASYLGFMLLHSVHHRGQLSAYLRAMGSKVPSIYGGSADEPVAG